MHCPQIVRSYQQAPNAPKIEGLARLETEISELAAHIAAATFQLLELICHYDEQQGWAQHGLASCAHWLQWQCGTNLGAAREKVRVARALPELPKISEAFRQGRISYSKVRAMTRVATTRNEECLLNVARHGTAAHVEQMVRNYRRHQRIDLLERENRRHDRRELSWFVDDDGMWVFKGRFTPEQGALIRKALEKASDSHFTGPHESESEDFSRPVPDAASSRRADALERMAESYLAGNAGRHSGGDRYMINIHSTADALVEDGEAASSTIEADGNVSAETSRRMACDASILHWHENKAGETLNVGRKTRSIPPAIRRALQRRDGGCRFPGCSCTRFVDAHHIRHWADSGETRMENLVLLCRKHHRLVHEGGFSVLGGKNGVIRFSNPNDEILPENNEGRFRGNVFQLKTTNSRNGLEIDAKTLPPAWTGEQMDYDLAQLGLEQRE